MKKNRWIGWALALMVMMGAPSVWSAEAQAPSLDEFLKQIQDKDGNKRREAWEKAGPLGAQAVAPLVKLLVDYNAEGVTNEQRDVSKAAGTALDAIAHYTSRPEAAAERKAINAELVRLIGAGQPEVVRIKALFVLASTAGDESVPAVAALLSDPDAKMRERVRWSLERIPGKAVNQALLAALSSATGDFRRDMILTLGQRRATEAVEAILGEAKSNDVGIRVAAIDALARIGDPRGREAILDAVQTLDGMQQKTAVDDYLRLADNLAVAGNSQAAIAIYRGVLERSKNDTARCGALVGLGNAGGSEALPTLVATLDDPSLRIRNAATNALTALKGTEADQSLADLASKAEPARKVVLLRVLSARKAPEATALLRQASTDSNMEVRVAALDLLGGLNDPKLEPLLVEAAEKGSPEAKSVALSSYAKLAAGRLGAGEKAHALAMYHRILDLADNDNIRRTVLEGLAGIASVESLPKVEKLMGEGSGVRDDATRAYIAIVLAMGKTDKKEEAINRLKAVAEQARSTQITQRAIDGLRQMGVETGGFAARVGFITRWRLLGPIAENDEAASGKAFATAEKIATNQPVKVGDKSLKWKEITTDDSQGLVNLQSLLGSGDNVVAFAYAEFDAPREREINLRIGSDDGFECWLNGQRLGGKDVARPVKADEDTIKGRIVQGTNRVLMKITQQAGDWGFCVRVANTQNRPLDLLRLGEAGR